MKSSNRLFSFLCSSVIAILLLTACVNSGNLATETPPGPQDNPTELLSTPTDSAPVEIPSPKVVLISEDLPQTELDIVSSLLQEYASVNAAELLVSDSLSAEAAQNAKLVFVSPPPDNLPEVASDNPETKFIVVSDRSLDLPQNAQQILSPAGDLYFVAGYLSALISGDWRVSAIVPSESVQGSQVSQIFSNGAKYLCGLCASVFAPVMFFPTIGTFSPPAEINALNSAYGEIANSRPTVIFVPSRHLLEDFALSLRQNGHIIVSDANADPAKSALSDIRIGFDISGALAEILNSDGASAAVITAGFYFEGQEDYLSPGKRDHLNIVLGDLQKGFISPYQVSE